MLVGLVIYTLSLGLICNLPHQFFNKTYAIVMISWCFITLVFGTLRPTSYTSTSHSIMSVALSSTKPSSYPTITWYISFVYFFYFHLMYGWWFRLMFLLYSFMGIVGLFILGLVGGVISVLLLMRVTCEVCGSILLGMWCRGLE